MSDPAVTIVVVPRERFSMTQRNLESIYKNTSIPFNLVYVNGGSPAPIRTWLEHESERRGFRLLSVPHYLSPNQARNLSLSEIHTRYVVFLDNDALVAPRWLDHLVECADETGAWIVGPLYLHGEFQRAVIHMAGGRMHLEEQGAKRVFWDEQYLFETPLHEAPMPLQRRACDYVEFHCMLVRTSVFERTGPMDEELLSLHEERDICLNALRAGGSVYMEPRAVVTFVAPPPCELSDLPYFMLRWNEAWNVASVRHFDTKWGVAAVRHSLDKDKGIEEDSIIGYGRSWRRRVAGKRVREENNGKPARLPLEEAELMAALFQSVDRPVFDLGLTSSDGKIIDSAGSLLPHEMLQRLPAVLRRAEESNVNAMIRPVDQAREDQPKLIRMDNLGLADLDVVGPSSFMTLKVGPNRYQAWLAVDKRNTSLGSITVNGTDIWSNAFVPLAGATFEGTAVQIVDGVVGLLTSARQLQAGQLHPFLTSSVIQ